ncbi:hypothetical protein JCM3774_005841 [Rhodotorula dairenensis]
MSTAPAAEERPAIYPVLSFANPDSAVPEIAATTSGIFLTTTLTPEEQRAEWERERSREAPTADDQDSNQNQEQAQRAKGGASVAGCDKEDKMAKDGAASKEPVGSSVERSSGAYRLL